MVVALLKSFSRRHCRIRLRRWILPIIFLILLLVWVNYYNSPHSSGNDGQDSVSFLRDESPKQQGVFHYLHRDFVGKQLLEMSLEKSSGKLKEFFHELFPMDWGRAKDADEMVLEVKSLLNDLGYFSKLTCKEIDSLRPLSSLTKSERKYVDLGILGKEKVVYKSQGRDVNTKVLCMKSVYNYEKCSTMGNYQLLRDILLRHILRFPGITQLLGYCLRGDKISGFIREKGVVLVEEHGDPLLHNNLNHYSWQVKLEIMRQIAWILVYLEQSPLGSLRLNYLGDQDFVIVHDAVKLADLDDVIVGELPCHSSKDCHGEKKLADPFRRSYTSYKQEIPGVQCAENLCLGLNAKLNLQKATQELFVPLLENVPQSAAALAARLLRQLRANEMTGKELVKELDSLLNKAGTLKFPLSWYVKGQQNPDGNSAQVQQNWPQDRYHRMEATGLSNTNNDNPPVHFQAGGGTIYGNNDRSRNHILASDRGQNSLSVLADNNANFAPQGKQEVSVGQPSKPDSPPGLHNILDTQPVQQLSEVTYLRYNNSNLPGIFDYPCPNSRASWGCVKTAGNLTHAQAMCTVDLQCKGFVVISMHIERSYFLTVIYKNSTTANHIRKEGTTLFVKVVPGGQVAPLHTTQGGASYVKECIARSRLSHKTARKIREKRLMAHVGLKGKTESFWKQTVQEQSVTSAYPIVGISSSHAHEGRFVLEFASAGNQLPSQTIIFKAQKGSLMPHIGEMVVHHLDRLLGLYHTPPAVRRVLSKNEVRRLSKNELQFKQFLDLAENDGSVEGYLTITRPKSITNQAIPLQPITRMASKTEALTKQQKIFLEYLLILWLVKIKQSSTSFLGYKGHIIHFSADQAFTDYNQEWIDYFNHCHFPNIAYKTMNCFRCTSLGSQVISVCGLGEKVFSLLMKDGVEIPNAYRRGREEIMDTAAAEVLNLVDKCIKKHGRKNVLF